MQFYSLLGIAEQVTFTGSHTEFSWLYPTFINRILNILRC